MDRERFNPGGVMNMRKAAGYLGDSIRKYGVGATLHDLECRLINKAVQFQILKGMTVRTRDVRDPGLFKAPGFDARFLREGELWLYAQDPAHQMTPEFLSVALARGDRCYALVDLRQGNLAAYGWYSDRSTPLDGLYHAGIPRQAVARHRHVPRASGADRGRQERADLLRRVEQLRLAAFGDTHGLPGLRRRVSAARGRTLVYACDRGLPPLRILGRAASARTRRRRGQGFQQVLSAAERAVRVMFREIARRRAAIRRRIDAKPAQHGIHPVDVAAEQ
jgi:hypothetical protein